MGEGVRGGVRRAACVGLLVGVVLAAGSPASAEQAGSGVRAFQSGLVDVGGFHSCAVLVDGSAGCWGADDFGQLGDGASGAQSEVAGAVALPAGRRAVAVSTGEHHSCAVLDDGSARCWGGGLLGNGEALAGSAVPVVVALPAGRRAVAVSAGEDHSCVVLDDGSARCWGSDEWGQLGNGEPLAGSAVPVLVALPAGRRAVAVSAGYRNTCAVLDDGSARCWGSDESGQLGNGAPLAGSAVPVPVALPAGRRAVAIAAGGAHSCAVLDDGSARCWGYGGAGELGNGASLQSALPVVVALPAGRRAVAISAGYAHSCAVLDDGSARCWGDDGAGQLGDGATTQGGSSLPVAVSLPAGRRAVAIAAGSGNVALSGHTCAVLDDGSVTCWGSDHEGQLGDDVVWLGSAVPAAPALRFGSLAGRVADLSVAVSRRRASLLVGGRVPLVVTLRNDGPDAARGVRVLLDTPLVEVRSVGGGAIRGRVWEVGSLVADAQATLTLVVTGAAAGDGVLAAQVLAASQPDPDSAPADDAAGADDAAHVAVAVRVPVNRLTLALATDRHVSARLVIAARGMLLADRAPLRRACTGAVSVSVTRRGRVVVARRAALRLRASRCAYRARLVLPRGSTRASGTLRVRTRFAGNGVLAPAASRARTFPLRQRQRPARRPDRPAPAAAGRGGSCPSVRDPLRRARRRLPRPTPSRSVPALASLDVRDRPAGRRRRQSGSARCASLSGTPSSRRLTVE